MKKIEFAVMLQGRYICSMQITCSPLFPITEEEIKKLVESRRPTLKGKQYNVVF